MKQNKINPQVILSTLWIFILFNIIFRDLHEFLNEGFVRELMTLQVTELEKLLYGVMLEIPIAMVLLSRVLNEKSNRWTNLAAGVMMLLGLLAGLTTADLDDVFFSCMNAAALLLVIRTAWRLPTLATLDFSRG